MEKHFNSSETTPGKIQGLTVVRAIYHLTKDTVAIRVDRNGIDFLAGQYVILGLKDGTYRREYSIFSSETDDYIDLLIKVIPDGNISVSLANSKIGDQLYIEGPMGEFVLDKSLIYTKKHFFVATGTGIAPFHSIILSYPGMDYKMLHGVRHHNESYGFENYDINNYILCTSRDKNGDFHGRVTDYLKRLEVATDFIYYLCGNGSMVYDAFEILTEKGIRPENIRTEVYF